MPGELAIGVAVAPGVNRAQAVLCRGKMTFDKDDAGFSENLAFLSRPFSLLVLS